MKQKEDYLRETRKMWMRQSTPGRGNNKEEKKGRWEGVRKVREHVGKR